MAAEAPGTPELDRWKALIETGQTEALARFLAWLEEQGYVIAEWVFGELVPVWKTAERLGADYFELDPGRIEREKQAVLEYVKEFYRDL